MHEANTTQEEQRKVAEAKEYRHNGNDRMSNSYPKRFNPIDLLADTAVPCLTRIAENTSVPSTMLEQLAMHDDPRVREAVADNPNTPLETLWALVADVCADVRYAIAENHNVPLAILSALTDDENPYVCHRAQSTIGRLTGVIVLAGNFGEPTAERVAG